MGWAGWLIAGPIGALVEELLSSDSKSDTPSPSSISDDEVKRVQRLIEDGRRHGVSEIDIEISQEFARNLDLNASSTIEAIPISVGVKIDRNRSGKCVLKVKYLPPDVTDKIRDLHRLHKEGALTDEEFMHAKQQVISKI